MTQTINCDVHPKQPASFDSDRTYSVKVYNRSVGTTLQIDFCTACLKDIVLSKMKGSKIIWKTWDAKKKRYVSEDEEGEE